MISTRWHRRTRAVLATTALGVAGFGALALRGNARQEAGPPPVTPTEQVLSIQTDFEKVADALRPSVVSIRSQEPVPTGMFRQGMQQGNQPFGFQFPNFPAMPGAPGQQFRIMPMQPGPQFPQHTTASGSGLIVDPNGWILTNDHVVAGADKVTVTLLDGRQFVGQVRRDPASDLALIKIDATGLPAVQMANSDDVHIGQWAIAFGSPFALNDTMTVGVISSLHRHETIADGSLEHYYPSLLQTDASINPGNSGGPLVDVYGRVVGINVAIESPSGGNVGIGFAIPANTAKYVMQQLMLHGKVTRGYLGLVPTTLTYADQQRYHVTHGALVTDVVDGTPASKAGIQVADVITEFNGHPVADEVDLRNEVAKAAPGSSVPVTVVRNGQQMTVNVTVGAAPDQLALNAPQPETRDKTRGKLGISIGNVTDAQAIQQFHLKGIPSGAVVEEVIDGSPASEAGMLAGDVIVRMDGKPVGNAQQLSDIVNGLKSGVSVPVVVRRVDPTGKNGTQTLLLNVTVG